jgi:hypothetical protein
MTLLDDEQVVVTINPVSKAGNPAKVDGVPAWATSDPTVATLTVADDGLSATVVTVGPAGASRITVTADADLGDGVTNIGGTLDVTVVGGAAFALNVTAGTPTKKV